ncbi:MAG: hypothetical protein M1814_000069 [Vezdaea aestivalis]|nr:MAG: hypothetical protein M1814_000069 [Vezdaea aestivalis]
MRRVKVFSGSSHPYLTEAICHALGIGPAKIELRKFSNGETSVDIGCSIRDQDVYIVQSGSHSINDDIMELLIILNACKGGSANKITAVLPYFPYSRQSKRKAHRSAITARMIANLLSVAGVHHIITVDLHASQMQGFFSKPVDNLHAEPIIARWIRRNIPNWREAVVVSKNPGGTKRVTSLADALKLNFGIVTTDKRRTGQDLNASMISIAPDNFSEAVDLPSPIKDGSEIKPLSLRMTNGDNADGSSQSEQTEEKERNGTGSHARNRHSGSHNPRPSPLAQSHRAESKSGLVSSAPARSSIAPVRTSDESRSYNDERAQEVITGRLVHGHIVSDDHPSPSMSAVSNSLHHFGNGNPEYSPLDPMTISRASSFFTNGGDADDEALGGFNDGKPDDSDDDEAEPAFSEPEKLVTLVGNVRGRTVILVDDMIDKAPSWISAAETVVLRGGATKVYCVATHGVFGSDALAELDECDYIDYIVVTNTCAISADKQHHSQKLRVLDTSLLLSECIRRNHYGESISALFQHIPD